MTHSKDENAIVGKRSRTHRKPDDHYKYTREETPHFSAYLARLGEHAAQLKTDSTISDKSGVPEKTVREEAHADRVPGPSTREGEGDSQEARTHDSHPIGDRRTSVEISPARFTLGRWSFYFIAKIGMYWMELIAFHPLANLAFAAFILVPVASGPWRRIKNAITAALALALLYYDSWLPPVSRVISQASNLSEFSLPYLIELLMRFVSWPIVGALLAAWVVYWVLAHWLRAGVLVVAGMAVLGIVQSPVFHDAGQVLNGAEQAGENAKPDMDRVLQSFFDRESQRSVSFARPVAVPFDVIFIHVCSLSWDDIAAVGLEQHPLWRRFDFLLTRFNSASSYSAPSAIHLLRATCGQQSHDKLYFPVPENCYLMNSLQAAGFELNLALNHTGKFDNFLEQLRTDGRLNAPLSAQDGLEIAQYAFNNSPVYDDLAVLNRWLETRKKSASSRVALYYNTASLHDGNHFPGADAMPNTLETYKVRLSRFLDELDRFMQKLDESGRRAVVVMVPEHGAAVRGDKRQIAGLRDTPTPAITLVPVGIKVVGSNREGNTLSVDQPTSYMAISSLVARMLEKSPYTNNKFLPSDYLADLQGTPFVAQTERTTVAEYEHRYYFTNDSGGWEDYAEFNKPAGQQ
ncbi:MAG: cellulose biosynthesis protein BcsG [Gallionella sp.]|jgi:cellulose synthase operon protein YhjU